MLKNFIPEFIILYFKRHPIEVHVEMGVQHELHEVGDASYKVQFGDTLPEIARQHGRQSWQDLMRLNPQIKDPLMIQQGQIINVKYTAMMECN